MRSLILYLGLGFLIVTSSVAHACKLSFAVSNAYPPYHLLDPDGNWSGIGVDLFKLLANEINCSVEIINVPWGRTVELLASGEIDAVSNFSYSKERQNFSHFIGPHHLERMVVVIDKRLSKQLENEQDLLAFEGTIGKTQGTYYGQQLEALIANKDLKKKIIDVSTHLSRIEMLKAGRFEAVFEEESIAKYLFNTNQLDTEKYSVKLKFRVNPVFIGLSRKSVNNKLAEKFIRTWGRLSGSAELEALYKKYGLVYQPDLL